jgi:UDP-N-acetylglucosamine 1-carboxyvinyltransferase
MGAELPGAGSSLICIRGNKTLRGVSVTPQPDFVDIAGYIVAAAITGGEIRIVGGNIPYIVDGLIEWFEKFNISIRREKKDLVVSKKGELKIDLKTSGVPLADDTLPKIYPRPWPGFPVDVLPIIPVLASKTTGKLLIQNWMYETGMDFVAKLKTLGAEIFRSDPQKIIVYGPISFKGGTVVAPDIIQAAKALFLAALCDPVETTIYNLGILKRRYPNIMSVYRKLGANIKQ